jgi:hypothetical protein
MKLILDDYLINQGISDIKRIKNDLVIFANIDKKEKRFQVKIKEGQTHEETANLLESRLDKPLGRKLSQYIVQFICKPENWDIVSTSEAELKQKAAQQAQAKKYKPKHHFDNFEQWQVAVEMHITNCTKQ